MWSAIWPIQAIACMLAGTVAASEQPLPDVGNRPAITLDRIALVRGLAVEFRDVPAEQRSIAAVSALIDAMVPMERADFITPILHGPAGDSIPLPTVFVRFAPELSRAQRDELCISAGLGPIGTFDRMPGIDLIRPGIVNGVELRERVARLSSKPGVEFAECDAIIPWHPLGVPTDPLFSECWFVMNQGGPGQTAGMDVNAVEAWKFGTGSSIIAVLDDGVQQDHPDINQIPGINFAAGGGSGGPVDTTNNHGTAVAGLISMKKDNGVLGVGVCPDCKVLSVRVATQLTPSDNWSSLASWIADGLFAASNAGAVVSTSSFWTNEHILITAAYSATSSTMVHVCAIGVNTYNLPLYPATLPSLIRTTAVTAQGLIQVPTVVSSSIDFSAPGVNVMTCDRTGSAGYSPGDWTTITGNSASAAVLAGVIGLLTSQGIPLDRATTKGLLLAGPKDLGVIGSDQLYGWGIPDPVPALYQLTCPPTRIEPVVGATQDEFGQSVAISGEWAAIGVPSSDAAAQNAGKVEVLRRIDGAWTIVQSLLPSPAVANSNFGTSVALSGGLLVVGCPDDTVSGTTLAGQVHVFGLQENTWVLERKLAATTPANGMNFGESVATDGEFILVGAPNDGAYGTNAGTASIYQQSYGEWTLMQKLHARAPNTGQLFGTSIALRDGVAVVVAPGTTSAGGEVYVFRKTGALWPIEQRISAEAETGIANAVAVQGNRIVLGAPFAGDNPTTGAVSIYEYANDAWSLVQLLKPPRPFYNSPREFGHSVALQNNMLVVGEQAGAGMTFTNNGLATVGVAYVYTRNGATWKFQRPIMDPVAQSTALMGASVALDGPWLLIGAPGSGGIASGVGSAFVIDLSCGPTQFIGVPADLSGDGMVNGKDLALLLGAWGSRGVGDLDGSGVCDGADLAILLGHWSG